MRSGRPSRRAPTAAAEETGAELVYRAPETFDLDAMAALIDAAVAEKPDGLIVSIPSAEKLAAPIRSAVDAGIPVISINSGFDVSKSFGALLHVGQDEYQAGRVAGEAMRARGGKRALCLNHEVGNVALDLRCLGFIDGFGGSVEVLPVEPNPGAVSEALAKKLAEDADIDTVLALSAATAGEPAVALVKGLDSGRIVFVGSFDTSDAILAAVADRAASFAIDQQAFPAGLSAGPISRAAAPLRAHSGLQCEHRPAAGDAGRGGAPARARGAAVRRQRFGRGVAARRGTERRLGRFVARARDDLHSGRGKEAGMSKPVIVNIPHDLGREEARRRMETGFRAHSRADRRQGARLRGALGGRPAAFRRRRLRPEGDRARRCAREERAPGNRPALDPRLDRREAAGAD